jgi:hypothetical protein
MGDPPRMAICIGRPIVIVMKVARSRRYHRITLSA